MVALNPSPKPLPPAPTRYGSNPRKLARYLARTAWMLQTGFWTYYPERDLWEEVISYQGAEVSPDGRARLIENLQVYGREVYEAEDPIWAAFLSAHPAGLDALDCQPARNPGRIRRGVPLKRPSEALRAPDAYAVIRDGKIRERYVG